MLLGMSKEILLPRFLRAHCGGRYAGPVDLHAERDRFLSPGVSDAGGAGKYRRHDAGQYPHLSRGGHERERAVLQVREAAGMRREDFRKMLLNRDGSN